jgi:hypothetical protein
MRFFPRPRPNLTASLRAFSRREFAGGAAEQRRLDDERLALAMAAVAAVDRRLGRATSLQSAQTVRAVKTLLDAHFGAEATPLPEFEPGGLGPVSRVDMAEIERLVHASPAAEPEETEAP